MNENSFISSEERRPLKDGEKLLFELEIGEIVSYVMFGVVIFAMSQIIIWIIAAIPVLIFPFLFNFSRTEARWVTDVSLLFLEGVSLGLIVRHILKPIQNILNTKSIPIEDRLKLGSNPRPAFSEGRLEMLMLVSALTAMFFCLVITHKSQGLTIVMTTFEIFSFIFMLVFALVRFGLTRRIRPWALISLSGVLYSLWSTFKPFLGK